MDTRGSKPGSLPSRSSQGHQENCHPFIEMRCDKLVPVESAMGTQRKEQTCPAWGLREKASLRAWHLSRILKNQHSKEERRWGARGDQARTTNKQVLETGSDEALALPPTKFLTYV